MLTQEDDVEIHALAKRGWSISAIARHTGRDRKTIRRYLAGQGGAQRQQRQDQAPSCLAPFRPYIAARFELMATMRAMRRLKPDPVPEEILISLVEAAPWAPSGGNTQV